MGFLAEQLRGTCPFSYGSTINFGERIVPESEMTAFCVFAPMVLESAAYLGIDVGVPGHEGHDVINIQGIYPIHEVERQFINEHGFEASGRAMGIPLTCCVAPQSDPEASSLDLDDSLADFGRAGLAREGLRSHKINYQGRPPRLSSRSGR